MEKLLPSLLEDPVPVDRGDASGLFHITQQTLDNISTHCLNQFNENNRRKSHVSLITESSAGSQPRNDKHEPEEKW